MVRVKAKVGEGEGELEADFLLVSCQRNITCKEEFIEMKKNDRGRKEDYILLVSGSAERARDGVGWLSISTKDGCRRLMRVKPLLNSCATSSAADINPPRRARLGVIYKVIILLTKLVDLNRCLYSIP